LDTKRDDDLDVAFISLSVKQKHLDPSLGTRLLAFARLKRRPLADVVRDLGVLPERRIERTARLARYRVARSQDQRFALIAVKHGIVPRAVAAATLARQRLFYKAGRGFLRFLALLRAEGKITHEQDRLIRELAERARSGSAAAARANETQLGSRPIERSETPSRTQTPSRTRVAPAQPSGSTYGRVIAALA
jgi:hypothetical protein